jgi:ankyrin repeat protein
MIRFCIAECNSSKTAFSTNNVVQFLVQRGFDWNVVNNLRRTGFHLACISGNVNVIRFLLQHEFKGINELDLFGEIGLKI